MDITLERMLSLIPKKTDGKFVHGSKKVFAEKIGLNHPQIISDWVAGRNLSYKNYVYQVASAYNVSVEWLKGETDIKEKSPVGLPDEADEDLIEIAKLLRQLSPEALKRELAYLRSLSNDSNK